MFTKRLYLLPLLFLWLLSFSAFSQKNNQLNNTLIFKVKEQYRNVCFNDKINHPQFANISTQLGTTALQKIFPEKTKEDQPNFIDLSLIYQLTFNSQLVDVETAIQRIAASKLMEYVEPYYLPTPTFTPNDALLSQQYYLGLINAFNAWNITQGDTNIVIGITDTGWDPTHPDLVGNVKKNIADPINGIDDDADGFIDNFLGWDLGMNDNNALFESTSHGVHVTGIAAATTNNTTGMASVGFKTKFLPIKISNATGILTHAYQGIVYAADHNCFIINCSWGSFSRSQFQQDIINYATINKGALVVAAAGNDGLEDVFYPAGYEGVLGVVATDQNDIKKSNSNFGTYLGISAPGEAIISTVGSGGYGLNSGTSMAAPMVAGGAALVKAQFPSYTNQQVAAQLKATAIDISSLNTSFIDKLGTGRLNLFNAVSNTSAQFVGITKKAITDNNNQIFEVGDVLEITTTLTNFLTPITGASVILSSTSPFVNITNNNAVFSAMNMLDTASNFSNPFTVQVLSGAALNQEITLKATITSGTFSQNHYFTIILNPDFINMEVNQISTTITSKGKIGYNDANNSVGLGFMYKGEQLLFEAGLMISSNSTQVSDVIRNGSGQDQDFGTIANVAFRPPFVSALDLIGVTNDLQAPNPINISIKQVSYGYASAPDDKYVIVVYTIKNEGTSPLTNLSAGIFADWDIKNANVNKANVDIARKMGYVYALDTDSLYAGVKLLTTQNLVNYALDINGGGGVNISDGYTSAEKHTTLTTNRPTAGSFNGDDVAHVVSAESFNLTIGEEKVVAFALLAGDSLLDLQQSADAAQTTFFNDALSVNELFNTSNFSIFPNPANEQLTIVGLPTNEKNTFFITDISGKTLIEKPDNFTNRIDIKSLPSGIYFLTIRSANHQQVLKFIKN
ncbi:MAG: hypothetical protein CVT95_08925 [Bacteroidetes bacterium HGW-Bacteroidetes-12]|nr:MAG: hypothetical protein CVT95_08925 [Bacteroidetes bacterium HGW-Bacteroidetes-12]